jgi:citrate synthase
MTENGSGGKDSLTIRDNRTGREYEVDIHEGDVIRAMDLRKIKVDDGDFGMMSYDPGFKNTASTRSTITYIDGGKGILRYRGYPIEQLAERSTFLEVAYLILNGELPTQSELDEFVHEITYHTYVHENIRTVMNGFRYDAHAMSMLISSVAALGTFYPGARDVHDPGNRRLQIHRLVAKMPTLAAFTYRHHQGLPPAYPANELSYAANFLNMLFRIGGGKYKVNPAVERALDILFILHADHEQNCSTSTCRVIASGGANPFASLAGAVSALWGPLHGGANQAVIEMLQKIYGDGGDVQKYVKKAKDPKDSFRLMGFGHRVYKNFDPRSKIIKTMAHNVLKNSSNSEPLLEIALKLEEIALKEEYFIEKKLYPNVDFYSGLIYKAINFPVNMFPVMFAMGRLPGWIAQWKELQKDDDFRIGRPRQIYTGTKTRDYIPIENR